jgi:hypothetical protein
LCRQLSKYNRNTLPFLPWAEKKYSPPADNRERNVVLYFGYINHRINFEVLNTLAESGTLLRIIGPVQRTVDKTALQKLLSNKTVSLLPPQLLSEVDLSDVYCSILPYDANVESVNAGSISNRGFNLLSFGIPLVHSALAELVEAPPSVIRYCKNMNDYFSGMEYFRNNFFASQNDIQKFLSGNYPEGRYGFLKILFDELILKYKPVETVNTGY